MFSGHSSFKMPHPFEGSNTTHHRYPNGKPCRKSSFVNHSAELFIDNGTTMSPRSPSAREKRLTVAAGSGDLHPVPTATSATSSTPDRVHLQRTDHIPKCPQRGVSVRKRSSSSLSSSSTGKPSSGVELARRKARQLRRRRIVSGVITAFVALIFGALGFFAFEFGTEYVLQFEEEIRQAVREQEFQPLIAQYRQQIDVLLKDQKYLQERLRHAEAMVQPSIVQKTETYRTRQLQVPGHDQETNSNHNHQLAAYQTYGEQHTQGIQQLSKQMLVEKFGAGPYHVELQIAFPSDTQSGVNGASAIGKVLLELASADQMPHTVYTFLARVSKGLYDGCSFYHNAGHILVAGAMPNAHTPKGVDLKQRFVESGLEKIHFQEYNSTYPHKEWTVGLAGRPGGTEFYINKRDNSIDHGPGGQTGYEHPREADPCFARVVAGFSLVERMQSFQDDKGVEGRVAITEARIIQ